MAAYPELDVALTRTLDVSGFDLGADSGDEEPRLTVRSELQGVATGQWNVNNGVIGISTVTDDGARAYLLAPATRENLVALWNSDLKQNHGLNVPFSAGQRPQDPAAARELARFRLAAARDVALETSQADAIRRRPAAARWLFHALAY